MKKLNNIACVWFTVSLLAFFGIESTLEAGEEKIALALAINLAAASAFMIATAAKLYKEE